MTDMSFSATDMSFSSLAYIRYLRLLRLKIRREGQAGRFEAVSYHRESTVNLPACQLLRSPGTAEREDRAPTRPCPHPSGSS